MNKNILGTAAVALKTALKYRRTWNKNGPTVKVLRTLMPPDSKDFRVFVTIGQSVKRTLVAPLAVRHAVREAGFRITDYYAKRCVKKTDKDMKNEYSIGKVIAKDPIAKAAFDNDPRLQNSTATEMQLVLSCHPYDVIGMSTGRDWDRQSCMRLDDGVNNVHNAGSMSSHVQKDVAEGTMVAYAIRSTDPDIKNPLCRCLIKPFKSHLNDAILFRRETRVYGNPVPGFDIALNTLLRKLNANVPEGIYEMSPSLYADSIEQRHSHEHEAPETDVINWSTVAGPYAKIKNNPELLLSFVTFLMHTPQHGSLPRAMSSLMQIVGALPADIVKRAARLFSRSPRLMDAFVGYVELVEDRPLTVVPTFLRSRDFREALDKVVNNPDRPIAGHGRTNMNLTWLAPRFIDEYLEKYKDNPTRSILMAFRILEGKVNLRVSDIMKYEHLHAAVWTLFTFEREALLYDINTYETAVFRVLAELPDPGVTVASDTLEEMLEVYETTKRYTMMGVLFLKALSIKKIRIAANILGEFSHDSFATCLDNPKICRRIMRNTYDNQRVLSVFTERMTELVGDMDSLSPMIRREIGGYIRKNTLALESIDQVLSLIKNDHSLFPFIYPSYVSSARISVLSSADAELRKIYADQPNKITTIIPEQQNYFDLLTALQDIQLNPAQLPFDGHIDAWIQDIQANLHRVRVRNIDFLKYPDFITDDTTQGASSIQFLRNIDAYMEVLKDRPFTDTIRIITNFIDEAGYQGDMVYAFDPNMNYVRAPVSNYAHKNMTLEEAQPRLDAYTDYTKRVVDYTNQFPLPHTEGAEEALKKVFPSFVEPVEPRRIARFIMAMAQSRETMRGELTAVVNTFKDIKGIDISAAQPYLTDAAYTVE